MLNVASRRTLAITAALVGAALIAWSAITVYGATYRAPLPGVPVQLVIFGALGLAFILTVVLWVAVWLNGQSVERDAQRRREDVTRLLPIVSAGRVYPAPPPDPPVLDTLAAEMRGMAFGADVWDRRDRDEGAE